MQLVLPRLLLQSIVPTPFRFPCGSSYLLGRHLPMGQVLKEEGTVNGMVGFGYMQTTAKIDAFCLPAPHGSRPLRVMFSLASTRPLALP